jgi:manganese efflux pump family protein
LIELLITAFAVAMDAVAVSISSGMARGRASWREALAMSATFGVFQAVMPALGYAGGAFFRDAIEAYDHWVAFGLLAIVGGHMIVESWSAGDEEREATNPFAARSLLLLGFATSVDALAVGLSLSIMRVPPLAAVLVIGAVTFALCVPAVRLGARLGTAFAHRAEFVGGAVLIAIGAKILIEHLSGAA